LLKKWSSEATPEQPIPSIFKVLPKEGGELDQGSALVCWTVEAEGDPNADTWTDPELQESWIQFDAIESGLKGLCFVTGDDKALSFNHPAK
jgi:CRISPR-associated protein Csd1